MSADQNSSPDLEKQHATAHAGKHAGQLISATSFRVQGGPPQHIRLSGFREVFERYPSDLENVVCVFGNQERADCRCDAMHGTIEVDVPASAIHSASTQDILYVRVRVADYESPPISIRYTVDLHGDHNALMHADDDKADEKDTSSQHVRLLKLLTRDRSRNKGTAGYTLLNQCVAECIGTMFIVVFGVGIVCSVVTTGSNLGLYQIASVWGLGVMLAVLVSASVSGAHLNPAVSLAMALFRPQDFPFRKLGPYWLAQYLGGFLGGAFNLMIFNSVFSSFETANNIERSGENGILTAMAFGEYFPNPAFPDIPKDAVSSGTALVVEAWGTGILMFVILAVTDPRQKLIRNKEMIPFYIGFTVAVIMSLYTPLTQGGFNPARDFGPRLVAVMAGWGRNAIPGPRSGFWLYVIGPKLGAVFGALVYDLCINPGLID